MTSPQQPSALDSAAGRTHAERRGARRLRTELPVELTLPDGVWKARVHDISVSGVRCVTNRVLPVMTQVQLVLVLPGPDSRPRKVSCEGAVVRSFRADPEGAVQGSSEQDGETKGPVGETGGEKDPDRYVTAIFFTRMGELGRSHVEEFLAREHDDASAPSDEA